MQKQSLQSTARRVLPSTLLLACACAVLTACPPPPPAEEDAGSVEPEDAGVEAFCPSRIRLTYLDGGLISLGFTGVTHEQQASIGAEIVADIVACDDECRNCRFEGPIPDPTVNLTRRCRDDTSVSCETKEDCGFAGCLPLAQDPEGNPVFLCNNTLTPCQQAEDCGRAECTHFLGPHATSPIQPSCFTAMMVDGPNGEPPVVGRIDTQTGALNFDRFQVEIGSNTLTRTGSIQCAVCEGDPVRLDGQKDGTCVAGPSGNILPEIEGIPCDAQGASGIPIHPGVHSLDCNAPQASTFDLTPSDFGTSSAPRWTIDPAEQPACAGGHCWCGVCQDNPRKGCHSQADCPGSVCHQPEGRAYYNNVCVDECVWDEEELQGRCNRVGAPGVDGGPPVLVPARCFPTGEGAEIRLSGSVERLSDRSFSIATAGIGCAAPSLIESTSAGLGLPGLNISRYRWRVDLE